MQQEFDAILTGRGPGGAWTFLPVPFDVQAAFGSKAQVTVAGTLNGFAFRNSLLPQGDGTHAMAVEAALGATLFLEDFLDPQSEQPGDAEGEGQGRFGLARLNGVDALAGDLQPFRQFGLAPAFFCTKHLEPVLHSEPSRRCRTKFSTMKASPCKSDRKAKPMAKAACGSGGIGSGSRFQQ